MESRYAVGFLSLLTLVVMQDRHLLYAKKEGLQRMCVCGGALSFKLIELLTICLLFKLSS